MNKINPALIALFYIFCAMPARGADAGKPEPGGSQSSQIQRTLSEMEAAFGGVIPWLGGLYDPASGGFFESLSLKRNLEEESYGPDIQSTHMAITMIRDAGKLDRLPASIKAGFVKYFQSRQDAETGFFSDPDYPGMKNDRRTMGRALSFSTGTLRMFNAKPLYPLPGKTAASVPDHLASPEAFSAWLDQRPWHHAWTALDNLQSQAELILMQEPGLRDALIDAALRNVTARQDAEIGLIGGGDELVRLSGAFKLALFCKAVKRPLPGADALRNRALAWFHKNQGTDRIFYIRNVVDLLNDTIRETQKEISPGELNMVLKAALAELGRYRRKDGGFSSFPDKYYICPNDLYLKERRTSRAGPQGDVNGTKMAWGLRGTLYKMAGAKAPKMDAPLNLGK
ncbi:MAG: hypothetical protein LBC18_11170 [Opitutaceae bacterium]|jgi:hypothetical protein|nr:hypothetical protein [Opitutaceae bacterium]